jgi:hypothetical protein
MSVTYDFLDNTTGQDSSIDPTQIANHLAEGGFKNVSLTPDQMAISFEGPDGQVYDAEIPTLIEKNYGQIKAAKPQNVDESFVRPMWRTGIEGLPNDDIVRKAYLKSKLSQEGFKDLEDKYIVGQGEDWNFFNPKPGKWYALTNAKGFDMSDVTGAIPGMAGMAGSVLGGLGGAAAGVAGTAGVGSLPLAMAGAGAGGLAGRTLAKGTMAAFDPAYMAALQGAPVGRMLAEEGVSTAIDAAIPAVGRIPGVKQLFEKGIVSPIAKAVGKAGQFLGRGAEMAGQGLAEHELPRQLVTSMIPGLGQAQAAGITARVGELPFWLVKKAPAVANLAKRVTGNPEALSGLEKGAADLLKTRTITRPAAEAAAEDLANFGLGKPLEGALGSAKSAAKQNQISDFYGNLGRKIGTSLGGSEEEIAARALKGGNIGQKIGNVLSDVAKTGKAVEKTVDTGAIAAARALQYGGKGAKNIGRGLNLAGTAAAPFEARIGAELGGQSLAEEGYDWLKAPRARTPKPFSR